MEARAKILTTILKEINVHRSKPNPVKPAAVSLAITSALSKHFVLAKLINPLFIIA